MSADGGQTGREGPHYYYCRSCRELWGMDWMIRSGIEHCPACDGPVEPQVSRRLLSQSARPADSVQ